MRSRKAEPSQADGDDEFGVFIYPAASRTHGIILSLRCKRIIDEAVTFSGYVGFVIGAEQSRQDGSAARGRGYGQRLGAKQPFLCGCERIIAPRLFRESSIHLGCYQRIQWKKSETTS